MGKNQLVTREAIVPRTQNEIKETSSVQSTYTKRYWKQAPYSLHTQNEIKKQALYSPTHSIFTSNKYFNKKNKNKIYTAYMHKLNIIKTKSKTNSIHYS